MPYSDTINEASKRYCSTKTKLKQHEGPTIEDEAHHYFRLALQHILDTELPKGSLNNPRWQSIWAQLTSKIKSSSQRTEIAELGIDSDNGKLIVQKTAEILQVVQYKDCRCGEPAVDICTICLTHTLIDSVSCKSQR